MLGHPSKKWKKVTIRQRKDDGKRMRNKAKAELKLHPEFKDLSPEKMIDTLDTESLLCLRECLHPEKLEISKDDKKIKAQVAIETQKLFGKHVIRKSAIDIDSKSPIIVEIVDYRSDKEKA